MLFLPAAGRRILDGKVHSVYHEKEVGIFQSCTPYNSVPSGMEFYSGGWTFWGSAFMGKSVRLASVVSELTRSIGVRPARLAYKPRHARLDRAS